MDSMSEKQATEWHSKHVVLQAQPISEEMEECIHQIEIALSLPDIIQIYHTNGCDVVDKDLSSVLQNYQDSKEKLEKLEQSDEDQLRENEELTRESKLKFEDDFKNSVLSVLMFFRIHPNLLSDLRMNMDIKVEENEAMFIDILKMFNSLMLKKVLIDIDENPYQILSQLPSSSDQSLRELISQKSEAASRLKQTYEEINEQKETEEQFKRMTSEREITKLNQEVDQLNAQLKNVMLENRKKERIIQNKNETLEMEIEDVIQKFDNKMEEIQAKTETMTSQYEKEQAEMKKLEVVFSDLEVEYNQILEKRRQAYIKQKEEELRIKATIIIQTWWRDCCKQKDLKNEKTSKPKKAKVKKRK